MKKIILLTLFLMSIGLGACGTSYLIKPGEEKSLYKDGKTGFAFIYSTYQFLDIPLGVRGFEIQVFNLKEPQKSFSIPIEKNSGKNILLVKLLPGSYILKSISYSAGGNSPYSTKQLNVNVVCKSDTVYYIGSIVVGKVNSTTMHILNMGSEYASVSNWDCALKDDVELDTALLLTNYNMNIQFTNLISMSNKNVSNLLTYSLESNKFNEMQTNIATNVTGVYFGKYSIAFSANVLSLIMLPLTNILDINLSLEKPIDQGIYIYFNADYQKWLLTENQDIIGHFEVRLVPFIDTNIGPLTGFYCGLGIHADLASFNYTIYTTSSSWPYITLPSTAAATGIVFYPYLGLGYQRIFNGLLLDFGIGGMVKLFDTLPNDLGSQLSPFGYRLNCNLGWAF